MNDIFLKRSAAAPLAPAFGQPEAAVTAAQARSEGVPALLQYLRIAFRRKWVITAAVVACTIIGLVITLLMTPLYTASATIEIARESNRVVNIQGVEQESNPGDLEFYQTQYGLLESRALAERVARELKLADNEAFFEMFGKSQSDGLFAGADGDRAGPVGRAERLREAGEILLDNISISPVRLSRLVEIKFTSPDPELSARVTNAWTRHFIESNLERRFEATSYARKFLEDRLDQLRQRLEDSERVLVSYAANQRIINLPAVTNALGSSPERAIIADNLATLNAELTAATADMIRARSRVPAPGGGGSAAETLTNNALATLRQKRAEVAAEYAKMLVQFEPEYPPARALSSEIAQLDRSIAREESRIRDTLQAEYRASVERKEELESRVDALKAGLLDLRRRSIQYNIYQRETDTNRQLYDGLLQRYKEIGVAGGIGVNNISVVDVAAVPEKPSSPKLLLNLLASIVLGFGLGVAAALALEHMDEAISDPTEIGKLLNLPVLGTVPKAEGSPTEALADRKSSLVEAYLSVQTNLEFSTDHGVPRTLSVTSTRPAEGKSTTAYAVAHALARSGKKVVLVDGDMRSPSVNQLFGIDNDRGLSNFLAGAERFDDLVRPTSLEGLSVMTSGPQPPNAAELLTGNRLAKLLDAMSGTYDHIVVDSPPVMGLADAPLIASRVEGVIYAVESHGIRASMVKVALDRLRAANANIVGAVLTKFEARRALFGYGYDYGYSYGEPAKSAA